MPQAQLLSGCCQATSQIAFAFLVSLKCVSSATCQCFQAAQDQSIRPFQALETVSYIGASFQAIDCGGPAICNGSFIGSVALLALWVTKANIKLSTFGNNSKKGFFKPNHKTTFF